MVPDIDEWILKIADVRIPRNLVGHMNFPNHPDRQRIDTVYSDFETLVARIENSGIAMKIP